MNLEDLDHYHFKHGGGIFDLGSPLEPTKLVHGHDEANTQRRLDLMPVDLEKFINEIAVRQHPPCWSASPPPMAAPPLAAAAVAATPFATWHLAQSVFLFSRAMH